MKRFIKNAQDGFTLLEVMISTAILSVLLVAFVSFYHQQGRDTQAGVNAQNSIEVRNTIQRAATNPDAVNATQELEF